MLTGARRAKTFVLLVLVLMLVLWALRLCRSESEASISNVPAVIRVRSISEGNSPEPDVDMNASLDVVGVGDHIHNFVYRFAPWHDLGCWRDTGDGRTMTLLANFRRKIDWFHMEKTGTYE